MGAAMNSIAILTPDPSDEHYRSRWREVLALYAARLEAHGVSVEGRCWADTGDLSDFALVMPLLAWGYHRAGGAWRQAVTRWEEAGVRLANSAPVLHWNADKLYLQRLRSAGAPVVPTLFVEQLDEARMVEAAARFGTDRLIAKPQVSAGAWQTVRWSPGTALSDGPTGAAMVQPYLPDIEDSGEISLIYFGGTFSHAIRKRPKPGDFRVQPEYDAIITAHTPEGDERAAAEAVLAAVKEELLYARVDLVRDQKGQPLLMEIELVEPDLYLRLAPDEGSAFGEAVARAVSAG